MSPEDNIKRWEEELQTELRVCTRIAAMHHTAKEMVVAMKIKVKEVKDRYREELKEKRKLAEE